MPRSTPALVALALLAPLAAAWTTSSAGSAFAGAPVLAGRPPAASPQSVGGRESMVMRKDRSVPPHMRKQYQRMQEMQRQREMMAAATKPSEDGLPVFNLFVRADESSMWLPISTFKGDDRAAALVKSYASGGLLSGVSKKQLDDGVSGSLFREQKRLVETICRQYPPLRKSRDNLQFGYKLAAEGLDEEKSKIVSVELKEQKGLLDGIKEKFFGGSGN